MAKLNKSNTVRRVTPSPEAKRHEEIMVELRAMRSGIAAAKPEPVEHKVTIQCDETFKRGHGRYSANDWRGNIPWTGNVAPENVTPRTLGNVWKRFGSGNLIREGLMKWCASLLKDQTLTIGQVATLEGAFRAKCIRDLSDNQLQSFADAVAARVARSGEPFATDEATAAPDKRADELAEAKREAFKEGQQDVVKVLKDMMRVRKHHLETLLGGLPSSSGFPMRSELHGLTAMWIRLKMVAKGKGIDW